MGKLNKKYKVDDLDLIISPYDGKSYKNDTLGNKIFIELNARKFGLNICEAKVLIPILQEIIETIEYEPVCGDSVIIIDGSFKGMTGIIQDIDSVATKRELTVKIDKTENNDSFYAYINKCDVE